MQRMNNYPPNLPIMRDTILRDLENQVRHDLHAIDQQVTEGAPMEDIPWLITQEPAPGRGVPRYYPPRKP